MADETSEEIEIEKIMELVTIADRELDRLTSEELRFRPSIEQLARILEEKKRILDAQMSALIHIRRLVELSETRLSEKKLAAIQDRTDDAQ